jgi:hypothetical protein
VQPGAEIKGIDVRLIPPSTLSLKVENQQKEAVAGSSGRLLKFSFAGLGPGQDMGHLAIQLRGGDESVFAGAR